MKSEMLTILEEWQQVMQPVEDAPQEPARTEMINPGPQAA